MDCSSDEFRASPGAQRPEGVAESAKSMNPTGVSMEDLPYQFHVAESVVPQFALSNTPTAILRELVQNEYDA